MEKILARRFAPFNFSAIPGFPNVVPSLDEWGDYLPIFGKGEEDNPAQHLIEFHELMHQWEIHHEDVLLKMFMFSLVGDARKWYRSLPPATISSLSDFHAAFTTYCQRLYPPELICHNCCEGYHNSIQEKVVSDESCGEDLDDLDQNSVPSPPHPSASEAGYESDKVPREEDGALSKLIEQVKYLSAQLEGLKHEDCAEDFPVLEADTLSNSFEEIVEDLLDELASTPDELAVSDQSNKEVVVEEDCSLFLHEISHDVFKFGVETEERGIVPFLQVEEALSPPDFDDYLEEEQQSPTSPFSCQSSQTTYDSYESESELDMLGFQEQVAEPYPLLAKENYHEEIIHLGLSGDAEQYEEGQNLPGGPIYDGYGSDPGESQEEEREPEEQSALCSEPVSKQIHPMVPIYDEYESDLGETEPEEQNISCPEPVSEQPPPENNEPTSAVHHQPVLIIVIQPQVNNCVAENAACRQFSRIGHSFYDPVSKYMEWHFLHALELPTFIFMAALKHESKDVAILSSWLHRLLSIINRRKELLFRKLLGWLWRKFAFT
jgi:hypothetical protein